MNHFRLFKFIHQYGFTVFLFTVIFSSLLLLPNYGQAQSFNTQWQCVNPGPPQTSLSCSALTCGNDYGGSISCGGATSCTTINLGGGLCQDTCQCATIVMSGNEVSGGCTSQWPFCTTQYNGSACQIVLASNQTFSSAPYSCGGGSSNPSPDFSISMSPPLNTVNQGSGTTYNLTISPQNGYVGTVSLSAVGACLGNGITCTLQGGNSVNLDGISNVNKILDISTSIGTPATAYNITVDGNSGSLNHSQTSQLQVNLTPIYSYTVASPISFSANRNGPLPSSKVVRVTNTGNQTLNLTLSEAISWANIGLTSINSFPIGTYVDVPVSITSTSLTPGPYSGLINFTNTQGAGNKTSTVNYTVVGPTYSYTVTSPLSFSAAQNSPTKPASQSIVITNTSNQSLTIKVAESIPWASINKTSFTLAAGASTTVAVSITNTNLNPQLYSGTVNFTNTQGAGNKTSSVNYTVTAPIASTYSYTVTSPLSFSAVRNSAPLPASQDITVVNTGNQSLNLRAAESISWASINKTTFTLAAGATTTVTVSITTTNLTAPRTYTGTVNFTNTQGAGNKTSTVNYNVTTSVTPPNASVNLSASPSTIPYNTFSTLTWSYSNATSCTITPPATIGGYPSGGGSVSTGNLTASRTYTISCNPGPSSRSVTVNVQPAPVASTTLIVIKSGQGLVTGLNINCGSGAGCQANYPEDTMVTLTATPDPNRIFTGWSGSGCSGRGTCSVLMNSSKTVYANFAIDPNFREF